MDVLLGDDIKKILGSHEKVVTISARDVVKVTTVIVCKDEEVDKTREAIYVLELKIMKKYPDALFDFYVTRKDS